MKGAEAAIRQSPTQGEFLLYGRVADFPTDKAAAHLGYRPRFSMADGIDLSVRWLRHHGYLGSSR
jgi:nucleoside-diphosphate-sugar epimerase